MSAKPTVISTFAGCGGSSLGYKFAGFDERLAVEWDSNACQCLRANFPGISVFEGDIGKLSADEALKLAGLNVGELDVLDGSPPCQAYSTFGKRDLADPRARLFEQFVRLVRGIKPKVFVMENVSGLVKGKLKFTFAEILRELKGCDYDVKARLLNAKYFNVAQSRERLIFIGVRRDLSIAPSFPLPTTAGQSVRAALGDVVNDPAELQMLNDAAARLGTYRLFDVIPMGKRLSDIKPKKTAFSCRRLHPDRPSRTICKNDGSLGMHGILHPWEKRRLTTAECKRLASFPDDFQLVGTWAEGVQRVGNSVPPRFMQAIAEHIRDNILAKVEV